MTHSRPTLYMCDTTQYMCVTWLIRMRDMTHLYALHDSFANATRLAHMRNKTNSHVRHDSSLCVTWLIVCETWLIHLFRYNTLCTERVCHVSARYLRYMPHRFIERTPPPRGGFLFIMFLHQDPWVRERPSRNLFQVLRGRSSYSRFLMRVNSK